MLKKRLVKSRDVCKVTFELPKAEWPAGIEVKTVALAGEFNDWDPSATPLKRGKGGVFRTMLELEPGREYQFRYLVNGDQWGNDWHADAYVPNEWGTDNSVVATPAEANSHSQ